MGVPDHLGQNEADVRRAGDPCAIGQFARQHLIGDDAKRKNIGARAADTDQRAAAERIEAQVRQKLSETTDSLKPVAAAAARLAAAGATTAGDTEALPLPAAS